MGGMLLAEAWARVVWARVVWARSLMELSKEEQIAAVRQMMIDAMDATEQTGIDAALTEALHTFDTSASLPRSVVDVTPPTHKVSVPCWCRACAR